ncbi:hypothetical protein DB29_02296 [Shouchella clausii]|nr:hypothetical protein DB29_02296 [Shouchella clausii]
MYVLKKITPCMFFRSSVALIAENMFVSAFLYEFLLAVAKIDS